MLTIRRDTAVYAMSPENAPVARVQDGETLVFETAGGYNRIFEVPEAYRQ